MTAAMASGAETSRLLNEMSRSYLDACTSSATAAMELARDGMACRTPAEVQALQKKGSAVTSATIEASVRRGTDLYTLWAKAFEPILARTTDMPERLFRAIAD